jgi:hypothetical protein
MLSVWSLRNSKGQISLVWIDGRVMALATEELSRHRFGGWRKGLLKPTQSTILLRLDGDHVSRSERLSVEPSIRHAGWTGDTGEYDPRRF